MTFDEDRYWEKLQRWAREELPRYEIDGWAGERRDSGDSGLGQIEPGEIYVPMSAGVLHQRADGARVEVTSHRQDPDHDRGRTQDWAINTISRAVREPGASAGRQAQLEQGRAALRDAAMGGELECRRGVISVGRAPTVFEVYEVNTTVWAAFGPGAGVDITVESQGVLLGDIALVRAMGPPSPRRQPIMPPARTRAFPNELLPARSGDIPPSEAVALTYRDGTLSGTVGTDVVLVRLPRLKWETHASLSGSIASQPLVGQWTMDHRPSPQGSESYSAQLGGAVGSERVELQAELHFHDGHPFDHATISGRIADEDVQARVEPVNGGLSQSDSFAIDASLGRSEFSIYVSVNHIPNLAIVRGHIAQAPVYLDAVLGHSGGRHVAVSGSHQGPLLLLLLPLGSIVQFLR